MKDKPLSKTIYNKYKTKTKDSWATPKIQKHIWRV